MTIDMHSFVHDSRAIISIYSRFSRSSEAFASELLKIVNTCFLGTTRNSHEHVQILKHRWVYHPSR